MTGIKMLVLSFLLFIIDNHSYFSFVDGFSLTNEIIGSLEIIHCFHILIRLKGVHFSCLKKSADRAFNKFSSFVFFYDICPSLVSMSRYC